MHITTNLLPGIVRRPRRRSLPATIVLGLHQDWHLLYQRCHDHLTTTALARADVCLSHRLQTLSRTLVATRTLRHHTTILRHPLVPVDFPSRVVSSVAQRARSSRMGAVIRMPIWSIDVGLGTQGLTRVMRNGRPRAAYHTIKPQTIIDQHYLINLLRAK